jgi:hypothetical protein
MHKIIGFKAMSITEAEARPGQAMEALAGDLGIQVRGVL